MPVTHVVSSERERAGRYGPWTHVVHDVEGRRNPGGGEVHSTHGIVGAVCRVAFYDTLHGDAMAVGDDVDE